MAELLAEVAEERAPAAGARFGKADHRVQLVQLDADLLGVALVLGRAVAAAPAALDERAHDGGVAEAEEEQGLGRQAVAPRPPRLLVVALDRLGQVVVDDEAHVALVDAHAERDRGHDDEDVVAGEGILHAPALGCGQAGVVGRGRDAGRGQPAGHLFGALAREAVDDAGFALVHGEEGLELTQRLALLDDRVADVRAVEPGDEHRGVGEPEAQAHIVAGLRVGRRRAGEYGDAGEEPAQLAELHVLGAEVVPPLADAVGLVDGEEGDAGVAAFAPAETSQPLEERGGHQGLGGDVEQVELAAVELCQHAAGLVPIERRVVGGGTDAGRPQRVDLVLHE